MGSFLISLLVTGLVSALTVTILKTQGIYLGFIPAFLLWMGIYWGVKKLLFVRKRRAE